MLFKTPTEKSLELIVTPDHATAGTAAAEIVAALIARASTRPVTIAYATGSSPRPIYAELRRRHEAGALSFKNTRAFLLDEYVGLAPDHPNAFAHFMEDNLFRFVDLPAARRHMPDGLAEPDAACAAYENEIHGAGGIDLMILGIGGNGHIAFNEPGAPKTSRTRRVTLAEETRRANRRFFEKDEDVPTHAITIGIANILEARAALLIANGASKAGAVAQALAGPVTADVPASFLQEFEGELSVVIDDAAAASLKI
ncbi:MAG: glucosamine-6-phosphate deaminase [Deltaproteobacteria bacterium]|nr:glucosamine-6-phosphate deaminase [Deltaproteobacteria bacterium]